MPRSQPFQSPGAGPVAPCPTRKQMVGFVKFLNRDGLRANQAPPKRRRNNAFGGRRYDVATAKDKEDSSLIQAVCVGESIQITGCVIFANALGDRGAESC